MDERLGAGGASKFRMLTWLRTTCVAAAAVAGLAFSSAALADFVVVNTVAPSTVLETQPGALTVTLRNNNSYAINGVDMWVPIELPAGVSAADLAVNSLTTNCGGTVVRDDTTAGFTRLHLTGATLQPNGAECTVTASLVASKSGTYPIVIPAGSATSSTGDKNAQATSFDWRVDKLAPITGTKAFGADPLRGGQTTTVTIRLTNPNSLSLTGVKFNDALPAQLKPASPLNAQFDGCGAMTSSVSGNTVQLIDGTIAPDAVCEIKFDVTPTDATAYHNGNVTNTIPAGAVTADQNAANTAAFSGATSVRTGVQIAKSFGQTPIANGSTGTFTLTVTNYNAVQVTGFGFTDNLPQGTNSGVTVPVSTGGTCTASPVGGAVSTSGNSFVLSGATLAAASGGSNASCTLTFSYTAYNVNGQYEEFTNGPTQITGATGTAAGQDVTPSVSGANVVINPTGPGGGGISATKNFRAAGTTGSGVTSLDGVRQGRDFEMVFTLSNHNATHDATSVNFSDDFTAMGSDPTLGNFVLATGASSSCTTLTPTVSAGNLQVTGSIPANTTCTVVVNAHVAGFANTGWTPYNRIGGRAAGDNNQFTATINGSPAKWHGLDFARVNITETLTIAKSFSPTEISSNLQTSVMTIRLNRAANAPKLTGVAFVDTFPTSPFQLQALAVEVNTCGGTVSISPDTQVSLTGGVLDGPGGVLTAASSCEIEVEVRAPAETSGTITNTIAAKAVSTDQQVSNRLAASAPLTASTASVTVSKNFNPVTFGSTGQASTLELVVRNQEGAPAQTGVALTDNLPLGMVVASPPNIATNAACGTAVVVTATPGASVITVTSGTLAKGADCRIKVDVVGQALGNIINEIPVGGLTTVSGLLNEQPASATISINGTADLATQITNPTDPLKKGEETTYTVKFSNNSPVMVAGNEVSIDLPASILPTNSNDIEWTCVATGTAVCPLGASGTGPVPDHLLTLPASGDGDVTYQIKFVVGPNAPTSGTVQAESHIKAPAQVLESNLGNNDSTVNNPLLEPSASILLVKTIDPATGLTAGQTVSFGFAVTNDGNVQLDDVGIQSDTLLPGASFTCAETTLLPTASTTCTTSQTYTVTVADVARGHVENTATAVGTPSYGATVLPDVTSTSTARGYTVQTPGINLIKEITSKPIYLEGSVIEYRFTIENTGDVNLTNVTITDHLPGISAITYDWTGVAVPGALAPGEQASATASYTVTADDVSAGHVDNTATVTGDAPASGPDVPPAEVSDDADAKTAVGNPTPVPSTDAWALLLMMLMLLGAARLYWQRRGVHRR